MNENIFKAYDIRGLYPEELNEELAYKIAQAYCKLINPKAVVLGRDVRSSGATLWEATAKGFTDHGVDVVDIGVITTDMLYFASAQYGYGGGITISASHNPREYNGMKMMRGGGVPISGETGIQEIKNIVLSHYSYKAEVSGQISRKDIKDEYLKKCLAFINPSAIKETRVVVNGMFGPVVKNIEALNLPIELIKLNSEPDGSFPKGAPDPLLPENRTETINLIKNSNVALGGAWDGDADRFFLFDENGRFIPGYFLTAFLGEHFAQQETNAKVIYDPRLTWAVKDVVEASGGRALINRVGHSFIKERMRKESAVFGGENSGHFYFRDFYYADNGLIPFLLILEIFSASGKKVSQLFDPYFEKYFITDENNFSLSSQEEINAVLNKAQEKYSDGKIENIDGISIEYPDWRVNIRSSNTQPLLRVNLEAKSATLRDEKLEEIVRLVSEK